VQSELQNGRRLVLTPFFFFAFFAFAFALALPAFLARARDRWVC